MRPFTWALKEVDSVGLHRQSGIPTSNLKLLHISKILSHFFFGGGQEDGAPDQRGTVLKHT
jgi:hypothetical protein